MKLASLAPTALAAALLAAPVLAAGPEKATRDDYTLDVAKTDNKIKAGGNGTFDLVIRPKNGMKVHPEAPLSVSLTVAPGLTPAKAKLGRNDVVDKKSTAPEVKTTLQAQRAGSYTVTANVSFFLCTDAWCQRMSDRVTVAVTVE